MSSDEVFPPGGSAQDFCLATLRLRQVIALQVVGFSCMCLCAMMRGLDKEMCHERVGSWMVVNT